jgi:hypothetical protein
MQFQIPLFKIVFLTAHKVLFCDCRNKTPDELIAMLKLSEGERYPAPEKLTPPLALYWASLAKYFKDEDKTEHLEKILGTVSELTLYVDWQVCLKTSRAVNNITFLQLL